MAAYDAHEEIIRLMERNEIVAAMEADHFFWQLHIGALHCALFVTLGRIFDKRSDAHSVYKVLDAAHDHIELFSHKALFQRRINWEMTGKANEAKWWQVDGEKWQLTNRSNKPAWWVPDKQAFTDLQALLKAHKALFFKAYRPLRHEYFAHRKIQPDKPFAEMFEQTNRQELGKTIKFLRDLAETLRLTFVFGAPPVLRDVDYPDRTHARSPVASVLQKLSQS